MKSITRSNINTRLKSIIAMVLCVVMVITGTFAYGNVSYAATTDVAGGATTGEGNTDEENPDEKPEDPYDFYLPFAQRLTRQASDNEFYYTDKNVYQKTGYGMPNCTAYAYGRAYEILTVAYGADEAKKLIQEWAYVHSGGKLYEDSWMAKNFWVHTLEGIEAGYCPFEVGQTPRLGAIACWSGSYYSSNGSGHVAVVEQINDDGTMLVSEGSSSSGGHYKLTELKQDGTYYYSNGYTFQGFIYILPENTKIIGDIEDVYSGKLDVDSALSDEYIDDENIPNVDVLYKTHIQTYGWETDYVKNGDVSGTVGKAKRLEGIQIKLDGNENLGVQYTTHVQTFGWQPWSCNDEVAGTVGLGKRLEAIEIQLTGKDKDLYDIYYRVHVQSYGWLDWAKNGEPAGSAGFGKRLEGIQILIYEKGNKAPYARDIASTYRGIAYVKSAENSSTPVIEGADSANISYRTHVQTYGWQSFVINGKESGTTGSAKRLEGIEIKLSNKPYAGGIEYVTHVQTYGWEDANNASWKKDGDMSGTSGQAKRLEAIKIRLTGEMAEHYDVYYRVHCQTYGWLGWAKNGEPAGSAGYAKRLEAIQIVLVEKNDTSNIPGIDDEEEMTPFVSAYEK